MALFLAARSWGAPPVPEEDLAAKVDALYPGLENLYENLHRHPELSLHETETAARLAGELRSLGFEVTTGVGGTGVVGVLRSGDGPAVMIRTELDALPVPEKTGLPFASRVTARNDAGEEVPVMHACGHDVHMTCWVGTARLLAAMKDRWRGTAIFIAQPAEEEAKGARAMLADGLLTRFPRPDAALAVHDTPELPAGTIGYMPDAVSSSSDSVDVTLYGRGGHGASPHTTVDPIVLAARTILGWQTLVSRENNPFDFAIVTVGAIQGGTRYNIIPDEVKLQLTVRAFREEVRRRLLDGIARIARGEAASAGAPKEPAVAVAESCPVTRNDPKLLERVLPALQRALGSGNVQLAPPFTSSEDFSEYGRAGIPTVYFRLGAADPQAFAQAQAAGKTLPSLHTSTYAPDREPTIKTGIRAETAMMLELLQPQR